MYIKEIKNHKGWYSHFVEHEGHFSKQISIIDVQYWGYALDSLFHPRQCIFGVNKMPPQQLLPRAEARAQNTRKHSTYCDSFVNAVRSLSIAKPQLTLRKDSATKNDRGPTLLTLECFVTLLPTWRSSILLTSTAFMWRTGFVEKPNELYS